MDGEVALGKVTLDERETSERTNGRVQQRFVGGEGLELGAKFAGSREDQFFGDGVGREEGEETEQVGGGWVKLLDLLKVEGPGGGNGEWMLALLVCSSSSQQEFLLAALKGCEVS